MADAQITAPPASADVAAMLPATAARPAGLPRRSAAWLIDYVLGGLLGLFVSAMVPGSDSSGRGAVPAFLVFLMIWYAYLVVSEAAWGTTLGKRLLGSRVSMADGRPCTAPAAFMRNATKALISVQTIWLVGATFATHGQDMSDTAAGLTFLLVLAAVAASVTMVLASERGRRLGDKLAGTIVVRRGASAPAPGAELPFAEAQAAEPRAADTPWVPDQLTLEFTEPELQAAGAPWSTIQPATAAPSAPDPAEPRVPWRWRRTVVAVLVAFAPELTLTLLAVLFVDAAPSSAPTNGDAIFIAASTVVFDSWWVAWAWGFSLRHFHLPFSAWGFRRPARSIFWVVPLAFFGAMLVDGLWAQVVSSPVPDDFPHTALGIVLSSVCLCLLAPMFEETFFRGFVFQGLQASMGTVWAAILSAAIFAGGHFDLAGFVPLFAGGLLLAWAFRRTGSIWGSIALHVVYNAVPALVWIFT